MQTFKIAFANIKKRKGSNISFLVMVFLAALMLSMSISLMAGSATFFENKVNELNAPHFSTFINSSKYNPEFKTFAENYPGHSESSEISALFRTGKWQMKNGTKTDSVFFINYDGITNSFYNPPLIDKLQGEMADDAVILPVSFKFNGFNSGETISLSLDGPVKQFVIYGFYEDTIMGSSTSTCTFAFVNNNDFDTLEAGGEFISCKGLLVRFEKSKTHTDFATAFRKHVKLNENEIVFMVGYSESEMGATTFMNIASMFLIVFSVIMLIIAFIVVTFSISSSIVEDIANIGAFKSMGYRNSILRMSQFVQYILIAVIGAVLGSLFSLVTFGFLGDIIASTSGLLWLSAINVMPAVISVIAICVLTAAITFFATRKYKKITPIAALRQGGNQKTSSVNRMPLERGRLPLNIHLGFKRFFNSLKNNISLGVTIMLLVFVSLLVFVMSYNMNVDRTAMINMVGLEMSDIYLQVDLNTDINEVNNDLKTKPELKNDELDWTMLSGSKFCYIDDYETLMYTVEDYSRLTINTVVKGRNPAPVADGQISEMTLGSVTADELKKGIGDIINVEIDGVAKEYKVVGITQNIANGGGGCNITEDAMRAHVPDFEMLQIYIYLKNNVNAKDYIDNLTAHYGRSVMAMDVNEAMDNILSSMGDPLASVSTVMIVLTLIIIAFVLFLITSALIRKNKKEFGIMKAIGYRNKALVLQLLLSLLPALVLGTVLGTLLGFFLSNPLLSMFFVSAGLLKTYFIIPVLVSLVISLGVLTASIIITYLIAYRLRKISPQKLIVEQ